jgi:hypothetical protein
MANFDFCPIQNEECGACKKGLMKTHKSELSAECAQYVEPVCRQILRELSTLDYNLAIVAEFQGNPTAAAAVRNCAVAFPILAEQRKSEFCNLVFSKATADLHTGRLVGDEMRTLDQCSRSFEAEAQQRYTADTAERCEALVLASGEFPKLSV